MSDIRSAVNEKNSPLRDSGTYRAVEGPDFLSTHAASARDQRSALLLIAVSVLIFLLLAPFAKTPLAPVWAFIPIYETLLVFNDLFTALLLYGQFSILRQRSLAILASGYLFTGIMAAFHALTFPGLFTPGGLLGAGPQTTAWLYMFWHMGFPLFVIFYALYGTHRSGASPGAQSSRRFIAACVAGTALLAGALAVLATAGHALLPALLGKEGYTAAMPYVASTAWAASLVALFILYRHRSSSVLDLWLMVVVCVWLVDVSLSTQINAARFDLGFYAGRIYGAIAASFILARLLFENTGLYAQLRVAHARLAVRHRAMQREIDVRVATEQALRDAQWKLKAHHDQLEGLVAERTTELEKANRLLAEENSERARMERQVRESEQRFRLLYENAPIGIAHFDLEGRWTYANRKFADITGHAPDELVGLSYLDVTPPEDHAFSAEITGRLLAGEQEIQRERRMLRKDGSTSWIRLTARMLRDPSGKPRYGIAIFEDIDERKQAEAALRDSEERFRATFEHAPLGIFEASPDGVFASANPKLLDVLGYSLDELRHLSVMDITHPADLERTQLGFHMLASGQVPSHVLEMRYLRKDGSFVWVNASTALRRRDGVPRCIIGIIEDVTARRRAEEDLRRALEYSHHLANHDFLTGLANRANFNDRLADALGYARRDEHMVAIHLLDLDRFKAINDTLGHHVGDLLLKDVAARLKASTRATDVVARLGGDEFVVIQTHLASSSAAGVLAGKIVAELGHTFMLEGQEVHSGTSIGIAVFPHDGDDPGQLVQRADLALYEAKNRGRYNFQFYRRDMGTAAEAAQQLDEALRTALHEGQFLLHYQPQFDLADGRISGVEAFLRWQHPEKGLLAAAGFIHHAESAGLMPAIGEWILRTACRRHRKWLDAGLAAPLVLNVSLRELRNPRFLQTLGDVLQDTRMPRGMVQLDIGENVLWDPKLSIGLLADAKQAGVRLAVDDFGTELAALTSLSRFPLDVVKPGRRLVKALPAGEREASILAAVVGVAHQMKVDVCAEGIETDDEFAAVKRLGCDAVQGFLLRSPLTDGEMDRLLGLELAHR